MRIKKLLAELIEQKDYRDIEAAMFDVWMYDIDPGEELLVLGDIRFSYDKAHAYVLGIQFRPQLREIYSPYYLIRSDHYGYLLGIGAAHLLKQTNASYFESPHSYPKKFGEYKRYLTLASKETLSILGLPKTIIELKALRKGFVALTDDGNYLYLPKIVA